MSLDFVTKYQRGGAFHGGQSAGLSAYLPTLISQREHQPLCIETEGKKITVVHSLPFSLETERGISATNEWLCS